MSKLQSAKSNLVNRASSRFNELFAINRKIFRSRYKYKQRYKCKYKKDAEVHTPNPAQSGVVLIGCPVKICKVIPR